MIDLRGSIPVFIRVTDGNVHDVNILDEIVFEPASIYVMDRGYVDFERLHRIDQARSYFVTRAKKNMSFYLSESCKIDKSVGLRCDQTIGLKVNKSNTRKNSDGSVSSIRKLDRYSPS